MSEKIEAILVDIGNTRIKSAEIINDNLSEIKSWEKIEDLENAYREDIPFMVCSTRAEKIKRQNTTILTYQTPLPIKLMYETLETLGSDRIAAAVGASALFQQQNVLVIDLGTCMTIDFISSDGFFNGGIISPGLKMRMKSMAQFTSNLPDISSYWEEIDYQLIGKSTKQCLLSGAVGGMIKEIEGTISRLEEKFTTINVILSGGDAHYFESSLKAPIFADSKIVLMGLHRVWKHHLLN